MNCLIYSLQEVMSSIPYDLLYAAFTIDESPELINTNSLEDKILRKLLRKRVLIDANICGGIEYVVPLNNINPSFTEYFYTVYNVPPELTLNKEIISALNLTVMPGNGVFGNGTPESGGFFSTGFNAGPPLTNVANRIANSVAPTGILSNAHIEIIGYNTVVIYAHYRVLTNFGLRVLLENDSNLNNIQPRNYKTISKLCILATKAYIYNKLIIHVNSGYLVSGQELGIFKSLVESYSDANQDYETFITEELRAVLFMNDTTRMNRFIGGMIAPDL